MGVCLPDPLEQTNQTLGGCLPQFMRKELPDHSEDGSSLAGTADSRILVQASDPLDRILLFGCHRDHGYIWSVPNGRDLLVCSR